VIGKKNKKINSNLFSKLSKNFTFRNLNENIINKIILKSLDKLRMEISIFNKLTKLLIK
jgi:hypothetical protein